MFTQVSSVSTEMSVMSSGRVRSTLKRTNPGILKTLGPKSVDYGEQPVSDVIADLFG